MTLLHSLLISQDISELRHLGQLAGLCNPRSQDGYQYIDCLLSNDGLQLTAGDKHNTYHRTINIQSNIEADYTFKLKAEDVRIGIELLKKKTKLQQPGACRLTLAPYPCSDKTSQQPYSLILHLQEDSKYVLHCLLPQSLRQLPEVSSSAIPLPITTFQWLLTTFQHEVNTGYESAHLDVHNNQATVLIDTGEKTNRYTFNTIACPDLSLGLTPKLIENLSQELVSCTGDVNIDYQCLDLTIQAQDVVISCQLPDSIIALKSASLAEESTLCCWVVSCKTFREGWNSLYQNSSNGDGYLLVTPSNHFVFCPHRQASSLWKPMKLLNQPSNYQSLIGFNFKRFTHQDLSRFNKKQITIKLVQVRNHHYELHFSSTLTQPANVIIPCFFNHGDFDHYMNEYQAIFGNSHLVTDKEPPHQEDLLGFVMG